jgi:hypothetical protein
MEAVQADMQKTQIPSWVSPAPINWGTPRRGKLSADQWKVICTIHLPITLIRLWGAETGCKAEMLSNFMDLVQSAQIVNMRIASAKHIAQYEVLMTRYLTDFKRLYKDAKIKPTHRTALHIGDIMRHFGPVHPYQTFGFERFNHLLQRQNINPKFGESFTRNSLL